MNIRDRIKELRRVRAGDLRPHPKNWRTHPEAQQNALRGILAEVGYVDALMVRELPDESLQIVDGHLRAETAPDALVPVLVVDLDDSEAEKALATFDPLSAMAEPDEAQLEALLKGIEMDSEALAALLEQLADDAAKGRAVDVTEDETPKPPDEAITKPGDLIILGDHRLLGGDSSKPEDVDRLLGGAKIHLVNTDPPYNVKVEPRSNNAIAAGLSSFTSTHHQGLDVARHPGNPSRPARSSGPRTAARERLCERREVRPAARRLVRQHGAGAGARRQPLYLGRLANCANYPPVLKACGLHYSQAIIWDKQHPVLTRKDFMGAHEWCFYCWKEGAAHKFFGPNNVPDLWQVKKATPQKMIHLTEKPVELAARAMQYSSRACENVLDLFGGSGSTLIAAEQAGRKAFLMELDPLYADVILPATSSSRARRRSGSPRTRAHDLRRQPVFASRPAGPRGPIQRCLSRDRRSVPVRPPCLLAHRAWHPLVRFGLPTDWSFWRRFDTEHIRRCDEVLVLRIDGWDESVGVRAEIELARASGKRISYNGSEIR